MMTIMILNENLQISMAALIVLIISMILLLAVITRIAFHVLL
jgi:hypothetical protein